MSREEREAYAREIAKGIREKELRYKQLSLDIQKLELSGVDGLVLSSIAGKVSLSNDPEFAQNGEVIIEVRGGSGLHISSVLGELDLERYPVGTELQGFSYQMGELVTARVAAISTMPLTTNYTDGGSTNSSGYLVVMEIVGDVIPSLGEYLDFSSHSPMVESTTICLHEAYISEVDGVSYVFVDRDGVLKREAVTTGKRFDSFVELVESNLTMEDYIAFPYDKNCKDGAPTQIKDESAFYGW